METRELGHLVRLHRDPDVHAIRAPQRFPVRGIVGAAVGEKFARTRAHSLRELRRKCSQRMIGHLECGESAIRERDTDLVRLRHRLPTDERRKRRVGHHVGDHTDERAAARRVADREERESRVRKSNRIQNEALDVGKVERDGTFVLREVQLLDTIEN